MRNMMGRSFNKMPKKEEEEEEKETLPFAAAAAAAANTAVAKTSSYYYVQKHAGAITTTTAAASNNKRSSSSTSSIFSCSVSGVWILRLRSVLAAVIAAGGGRRSGRGLTAALPRTVAGTLFGRRRGRVRLAFQADPRSPPALLLELAAPTADLVREMASGLVRIALECDRASPAATATMPPPPPPPPLLQEPAWRAYCNGRKLGLAVRRECGDADRVVLSAVEKVSVGAGVLPAGAVPGEKDDDDDDDGDHHRAGGDVMYMRAKFERVVVSSDSEAFYMISPDGTSGGPELSIFLLRV